MKANYPLLALVIGAFDVGTVGSSPASLSPIIARGVDVSIPAIGMLTSVHAADVMVGASLMTLLLSHRVCHGALTFLIAIFTLDNVFSVIAPNYMTLMLPRILTNLNHGAFSGLGSVVTTSVMPRHKQASTVATTFMGLTLANVGGVPMATWLSGTIGWRMSFLAITGLGVISMVSLFFSLPEGGTGARSEVKKELAALIHPRVLSALLMAVLGTGAMFTLYTYISPVLQSITHVTPVFVTAMLVLIDVGFPISSYLGGELTDRSVDGALKGFLLLLMMIMLVVPFLTRNKFGTAISMIVRGAATFAVVPPLQMCVIRVASKAPGLSSPVNIGAFNLGNALGATTGGTIISTGLGYSFMPVMRATVAELALSLVSMSVRKQPETIYVANS